MALQTLGIPEDLATVLSNLGLKKVGFPVWKLQKRRDSYSVNIFWRNAEKPRGTTPFSVHCEVTSKRKRRSQQRLEAFIEKKVQKLQDSFCKVSDAGSPASSDGSHGVKLSTTVCCVDIPQSSTSTPQDLLCKLRNAGTPAGNDGNSVKTPARCETPPATSCPNIPQLSTQQPSDTTPSDVFIPPLVEQAVDPAMLMEDDGAIPAVDLSTCSLVKYEEKSHVPGVRFVVENREGWTPVVKGSEKKNTADNGDGSRRNPVRSKDEILKLNYAKEVKYVQRNGTPGLTFRRGKTNHSYQWIPIVPGSPVATRTRTKLKI